MRGFIRRQRQRGVAVVTALLLTTLAISIVASLFWQQQVQVRTLENQRLQLQTKWILRGALDWASVVLRQELPYTSLDQVWATPLAETRLDQYIERERIEGEAFDASLSGNIIDATSRYNLTNLSDQGQPDPAQAAVFLRLLNVLRLDNRLAQRVTVFVAQGQRSAPQAPPGQGTPRVNEDENGQQGGGGGDTVPPGGIVVPPATGLPVPLVQVDDLLAVQGMTPAILAQLKPFLIVLPEKTALNVNTAPPELLAALIPGMSLSEAGSLVARRKTAAWRDEAAFLSQVRGAEGLSSDVFDVKSSWFLVQSRIRLDRAALNAESLIQRKPFVSSGGGGTTVIWTRQN
ncbi:type II secretion system minor pseudopilin GspK [uncultured Massilia sp.]|uniref:type II secretion system minor pseudopilin GspK n=1 Tax=uncultured Massilia sp. TaxID=169973 RepID=UPI00258F96C7|nr:type II secretion system minor pseudopilin GspK [uncultured Massilia sp.]